ncbi:MAG: OadG family transporter subunit [Gammaproteobacteria bacterium]|jgi:oxaloacetate decarboxylase gamma subunit|nr:OadG family transporter subunit [Gammaproteobacteria bacterium]MDP6974626.1 OadG family transporter subunit [Gammaproteobacteria bacterium]
MDNNLVTEALTLTMYGMGFVFVFLALMVIVTTLMSASILRFQPNVILEPSGAVINNSIDEEAEFVIREAIKMHREN